MTVQMPQGSKSIKGITGRALQNSTAPEIQLLRIDTGVTPKQGFCLYKQDLHISINHILRLNS